MQCLVRNWTFTLVQHLIFVQSITITRCGNHMFTFYKSMTYQCLIRNWTFTHVQHLIFVQNITVTRWGNYISTFYESMTCSVWSETGLSPTYNIWSLYRASQLLVAEIKYFRYIWSMTCGVWSETVFSVSLSYSTRSLNRLSQWLVVET